jgi:hypothetical protein
LKARHRHHPTASNTSRVETADHFEADNEIPVRPLSFVYFDYEIIRTNPRSTGTKERGLAAKE